MKKKLFFLLNLFFLLTFSITSMSGELEEANVKEEYNNYQEVKSYPSLKSDLSSYITNKIFDLTYQKEYDCDYFFQEIKNRFRIHTKDYISISSLRCSQRKNEFGQFIAESLSFKHTIESLGTDFSSNEVRQFLKEFKQYEIFQTIINYDQVNYFIKERVINADHSFRPYDSLLVESFFTEVKNIDDFYQEQKKFFSDIDFKSKESYLKFITSKVNSQQIPLWENLFSNPDVDVLVIFTNTVFAIINNGSQEEKIELDHFLSHYEFKDTRWDEFSDLESERRLPKNYVIEPICVMIDTMGTNHPNYPNMASSVFDDEEIYPLKNGGTYCFDYNKTYYMQQYYAGNGPVVWYGTTCRYLPYMKHQGKTLYYDGEHGGYKCPVR